MQAALTRNLVSIGTKQRQRFIAKPAGVPIPNCIDIYTDGSCVNNGKKNAISAIGMYCPTHPSL